MAKKEMKIDQQFEEFKRQWGVDGMPLDKRRIVDACWQAAQSSMVGVRGAIIPLTEFWYHLVNKDHHKDTDCHWMIETVWSYGSKPVYTVRHYGYVHDDVKIECASYSDAEKALVIELLRAVHAEINAAKDSGFDGDPAREAIRAMEPELQALIVQYRLDALVNQP